MDFHTLTRRELQALCKMNKIPANMTNVAMANALKALEFVEGIEEVMKPSESELVEVESPEKSDIMSSAPRTSRRTAIRTTAKKESEMSQTVSRTRQSTRRMPPQNLDEVKNEAIETPAAPTARRRAGATSVRSKMESLLKECVDKEQDGEQILNEKKDLPKTPGAGLTSRRREVKEKSSVQQVYSTRRSARLASKYEESSKQDTEMSQSVTFDSFTDETDEILDVNSKLSSLHLDEEQGKAAADSSAKELNVDMQQSSEEYATEEITNGLIENYATVDLSTGKESNDVKMDLQQGADLLLEGQEVVGDNMAGEVSECVIENAGALCGDEMVEDDSHFKGQEVCADEMVLSMQLDGEDEDNIDKISDHAVEDVDVQPKGQVLGDDTIQCKHLDDENKLHHGNEISQWEVVNVDAQVLGDNTTQCKHLDDENKLHHGNEISQWEVVNVDALNKGHKLAVDEMILLSKQLDEEDKANNTNGISDCEVKDVNLQPKCQEVVISEQLGAEDACNEELDCEVDDAEPLCKGLEVVGNGIILTKQLDEVNTKEISNTEVEEEDVHDEEIDTTENSECEVEDHGMVLDNKEKSIVGDNMALPNQAVNEDEQFNDEGQCMNDEISEQDASDANLDDDRLEKLVNPASKDVVDAPVLPLPQPHAPNSTLMLDPAHISSGVAETDSDHTFQISCLTLVKKPSDKTPREQSIGKTNMGVNHVSDDKENVDNSGIKSVLTKEKLKKKGNAEVKNQKPLEDLSLRQLTKMMKELKLQIAEKSTKAVSRPALQQVPENCLVGESRNSSED